MSDQHGADRVGHGEASLGEAQGENPPPDPEYLEDADRPAQPSGGEGDPTPGTEG